MILIIIILMLELSNIGGDNDQPEIEVSEAVLDNQNKVTPDPTSSLEHEDIKSEYVQDVHLVLRKIDQQLVQKGQSTGAENQVPYSKLLQQATKGEMIMFVIGAVLYKTKTKR